ncbi:MAG TPA: D-Ala-D-Ala carboxypeptidase family metallohydrolase [Rhizomicrobium sp.]|nr:D-Ala-D-Ala carboxypeptidase family metallohydrolase [Rhizomicrobium sp.]
MMKCFRAALALAITLPLLASNVTAALASVSADTVDTADSFNTWLDKVPSRRADVRDFEEFLAQEGVAGVLPTREILRNDTSWSECHMDGPYSIAERAYWPHIVNTLRYIHDEIVPTIGPVQVDSGYRDTALNRCSGGAAHSAHAQFYALDLVPVRSMDRNVLIADVCANHARYGAEYHIGLGFYDHTRFHIDSRSFRRWGPDYHAATSPCAHVRRAAGS